MKKTVTIFTLLLLVVSFSKSALSHCEVPCGIYQDELRIELIKEHIQTIEKAMKQITELQSEDDEDYNQIVRWVNTKEQHANLIQEIAEQYFLHQRVKFAKQADEEKHKKYIAQLTSLHQLVVFAMKSKQGLDLENIKNMKKALVKFEGAYFGEHRHKVDSPKK